MSWFPLALMLSFCMGCSNPSAVVDLEQNVTGMQSARIGQEGITPNAFAAAAEFLFPEEMQSVRRSVLRAELARREGLRLKIEIQDAESFVALESALDNLKAELGEDSDLELWVRNRWGCSFEQFKWALQQRLSENLLYQRVMRASVCQEPSWEVLVVGVATLEEAKDYASRLRLGADPRTWGLPVHRELLAESCISPIGPSLKTSQEGDSLGPFQLPGDSNWFLLRLQKKRPPNRDILPTAILKGDLADWPPGPLEARSWWEAMLRRYTASESHSAILNPQRSFVPF